MNNKSRIKNSTLGVLIGLLISIWWIFMGLDIGFRFQASDEVSFYLTLGGHRHTIMTIIALILIPICVLEKQWSFLAAMLLAVTTLTLSVIHVVYMLITEPSGYESQLFGPIIWSVMQIPIIFFGNLARQDSANKLPS